MLALKKGFVLFKKIKLGDLRGNGWVMELLVSRNPQVIIYVEWLSYWIGSR